jgi:pimeloyl-ACP methyl ester carboxylesterase
VNAHPAAEQQTLDVGEVVLAYDEVGEGPPVVYAHGLTSSRANDDAWKLYDWSALVAAGRRLVRYDARGHGQSTGRPEYADYTWQHLAGDLLALLDRVAGAEAVDVMGASMGCGTLLHAAVRRPERFRRLVLIIPPTAWETRHAVAAASREAADFVESHGLAAYLDTVKDLPLPPVQAQSPGTQPPPAISEELYPHVMRGAAATDLPDPDALRAVRHETLILTWEQDPGHPVTTAQKLNELLPNTRLHISADYADVATWGNRAAAFLTT